MDVRYIQELLGHTNIKTMQRYTHASKHKRGQVRSPLDALGTPGAAGKQE